MEVQCSDTARHDRVLQLEQEIVQLREQLQQSQATPSEKDAEISRLSQQNAELQHSLTEQTGMLKKQLTQTAAMCQQLATQLEHSNAAQEGRQVLNNFEKLTVSQSSSALVDQENDKLKEQVTRLNTHLQEVVEMNTRWQTYNKQREEYLQKLQQKLMETENKLASGGTPQLTEQQQAEIDRIILQYKQKVEVSEEEKVKLGDENRDLRLRLDQAMAESLEKDSTIRDLQQQLEQSAATAGAGGTSRQDAERLQMLEHQVQLCTEDFKSERRDRERAQSKIEELEQELRIVHRQLEQYQGQQMQDFAERRRAALQFYRDEYQRTHPNYGPTANNYGLVGRGGGILQADGVDDDNDLAEDGEGYDTIDGMVDVTPQRQCDVIQRVEAGESALHRAEPEDTLQCPKCKKEFPISKHEQLLEHTEACI